MKDKLLQLAGRFDALTQRERATVGGAVLVGVLAVGYLLMIDPQISRQAVQTKRIAQIKNEMAALETQMVSIQAQLKDPDASNKLALQEVRKSMAEIDIRLRNVQDSLVMPEKMQGFLEGLLAKNGNLELVSLRTLPPEPLIDKSRIKKKTEGAAVKESDATVRKPVPASGDVAVANIYKHAIEIRIAGNYNDLLSYVSQLENMPQRIIWGRAEMTVEKHPRCILTLTVYTLNLDKQWLVV